MQAIEIKPSSPGQDSNEKAVQGSDPCIVRVYADCTPLTYIVLMALMITVVVILSTTLLPAFPFQGFFGGLFFLPVLLAVMLISKYVSRKRIDVMFQSSGESDLRTLAWEMVKAAAGLIPAFDVLREGIRRLFELGNRNTILIVSSEHIDVPIASAITMPFEPRPLDEASLAADDLAAMSSGAQSGIASHLRPHATISTLSEDVRLILRNIRAGVWGWFSFSFIILCAAIGLVESITLGRPTWNLYFFSWMLIFCFYLPRGAGSTTRKQWWLVPGGVVVRKAVRSGWELHRFARRECLLCIYKTIGRQFGVIIAGPDGCETSLITARERELLFCAWLSPLEPPTVEKLTDLT